MTQDIEKAKKFHLTSEIMKKIDDDDFFTASFFESYWPDGIDIDAESLLKLEENHVDIQKLVSILPEGRANYIRKEIGLVTEQHKKRLTCETGKFFKEMIDDYHDNWRSTMYFSRMSLKIEDSLRTTIAGIIAKSINDSYQEGRILDEDNQDMDS